MFAKLIPIPFITEPIEIRRLGQNITVEYFERRLFGQCYGVDMVQTRGSGEGFIFIFSDPQWHRLIYAFGVDINNEREGRWLAGIGGRGNGNGEFNNPRGLCIDSVTYGGDTDKFYVYVADRNNDRIVRLLYDVSDSLLSFHDNCIEDLTKPSSVACATTTAGNSTYLLVTENDQHRIRIYCINQNLSVNHLLTYGSYGTGIGNFSNPIGCEIVPIVNEIGWYYIYITDCGNNRIVCLKFNGSSITWHSEYIDESGAAGLTEVTASKSYCVYVTAGGLDEIWTLTPGLDELLYEYNPVETPFLNPQGICIYNDEIAVTENWTATTGIQYFGIIPEIRDFYPDTDTFDALIDSVKINFKVCETAAYLTMTCCSDTIINNQYFEPGTSSVYWDGREGSGKPAVPGTHPIYIRCPGHTVGTAYVTVKGTKIEGEITDLHWQPSGNPYVLVDNSYIGYDDTLIIDPNVLVMGHNDNSVLEAGILRAIGSVNDSIIFTSHRKLDPPDPTNSGMWRGIVSSFNSAQSEIKFCRIEYAGVGTEIWSDFYIQVPNNIIENCYFYTNVFPAHCDFYSTGAFGYGNEYIDNDINKIILIEPPSDNPPPQNRPAGLNDITIKDQDIPFLFAYHYYFKYQVGGSEDEVMTLTIEPGVRCEFDENTALEIGITDQWGGYARGRLVAEGIENDSIIFTGVDGGFWKGIRFCSTSCIEDTSVIRYTSIEYAGQDTASIVLGDSTSITIVNTKICNSPNYGLWMAYGSPYDNITISQCLFENDSVPILSSFGNLGAIDTCTYSENLNQRIDVVGQDAVHKDLQISDYSLPYHFLNQEPYGQKYVIYGDGSLSTLTIDANVSILCDSAISIEIGNMDQRALNKTTQFAYTDNPKRNYRGKITALGNDSTSIIFTALDKMKPWDGISIYADNSQDTSVIKYCEISHALNGIALFNTSPVIKHSSIVNTETAIVISGSGAGPVIDSNLIAINTCGIYNTDTGSTDLSLSYNDIYGNKIAVKNEVTANNVDADSNWWGASSGPWDPTDAISGPPDYNPAGTGDSIGDYTVYRHWLTQPVNQVQVTLTFPNGGESLHVEIDTVIQWTRSLGITPIKQELYYTTDFPEGGSLKESVLWQFIDTVNVNNTNYTWNVPITPSHRCRGALKLYYASGAKKETSGAADLLLSVASREKNFSPARLVQEKQKYNNKALYDNPSRSVTTIAVDVSDANFVIADTVSPQITLIAPNGHEYFIPAKEETIRWQASDNHKLDHFDIYLSVDGGLGYPDTIASNLEAPCSTYAWTPSEKNSYKCYIKIVASDSSGNDNDDTNDSLFYIPVKSNSDEMSAYSNARRLIRSFSSGVHLVYTTSESGGFKQDKSKSLDMTRHLRTDSRYTKDKQLRDTDKVYYIKSSNLGNTWLSSTEAEIGEGLYPSMAMDVSASKIGVAWSSSDEDEIYYRYKTPFSTGWSSPIDTIFSSASNTTYSPVGISFANDTIHLVTLRTKQLSRLEIVQDVLRAKFNWITASTSLDTVDHWRITYSGSWPEFTSIDVDASNDAHIAWERPPDDTLFTSFTPFDVFYAKVGGLFGCRKFNVSNSDSNSINPSIDCYGGHYYVVWQEKIDGYSIFLYKRNYVGFPPSSQTDTISQASGNPRYPVSSMGGVVLWAAGDTAEIYGRIWDSESEQWLSIENWSNTQRHSIYPQVDAWQSEGGTDIIGGWTEDTDTSGLGRRFVSYFPGKGYANISFPSYCLMLGDSMSTPFTMFRDTIASYLGMKFDYGNDSLVYYLPYINSNAKCRLYIELYRPESKKATKESNKWKIKLDVDGILHQMIELTPGEMKKLDLDIPWMVNIDGSAQITFNRNKGDFILARRILFYEYETGEVGSMSLAGGGPQSKESVQITPIFFGDIHPNPTKGNLEIRFSSPDQRTMRITLYDVTGRLVNEIFHGKVNIGSNRIPVNSEELSAGIYFIRIETDEKTITEKVIILK